MNQENKRVTWLPSPAKKLENGFRKIERERMRGLPICNPHVKCQAVGFQKWMYFWFGVMVTPWAINLILSPGDLKKWKSVPSGKKLHYEFPAGLYDFISVKDEILGEYQMCSMISPLSTLEFQSHAFAVEVAEAILVEMMKPEGEPEQGEELTPSPAPSEPLEEKVEKILNQEVSRRKIFTSPTAKATAEIKKEMP